MLISAGHAATCPQLDGGKTIASACSQAILPVHFRAWIEADGSCSSEK